MDSLKLVDSTIGGDEVHYSTYVPTKKNLTVRQFMKQYDGVNLITVGFMLVDKHRKPITPMIHVGKGIIRPGVWEKDYYNKIVKKVYITDSYAELDHEIEVE